MAKRKVKSTGITFALNDPGMGEYERAGLAGLYMSLTAAQAWAKDSLPSTVKDQAKELNGLIKWCLGEDKISLSLEWKDEDEALTALAKWAWQVKDGVFFLPAIHRKREHLDNYYLRLPTHEGILNTFIQHNNTLHRKRDVKEESLDEDQNFQVGYPKIPDNYERKGRVKTNGLPQIKLIQEIVKKGITSRASIKESSWIYPGAAVRYRTDKKWHTNAEKGFLLIFTPLVCHYVHLPDSWLKDKKANRLVRKPNKAVLLISLESFPDAEKSLLHSFPSTKRDAFLESRVAGLDDAVLKYASKIQIRTRPKHQNKSEVIAVTMGKVAYYANQTVRKNFARFRFSEVSLDRYAAFDRLYQATRIKRKTKRTDGHEPRLEDSIVIPSARERITANILSERPWYQELMFIPFWQKGQITEDCKKARDRGLSVLGIRLPGLKSDKKGDSVSPERLWFLKLHQFERSQLMELSNEERMWDSPEEKRLLETLRYPVLWRLLNEEECAVGNRGGSRSLAERWDDTVEKWHRRFLRAKTRPLFRAVIHELLSTAQRRTRKWDKDKKQISRIGGIVFPSAKDDGTFHVWFWHEVNDPHGWQRIRDLVLLALVTFTDGRLAAKQN